MINPSSTRLVLFLVLVSFNLFSQDITIHQTNPTSNVSSSFGLGVTTFTLTLPMAPGTLSGPDLNTALALGDVTIQTPNGSIIFSTTEYQPTVSGRTLRTNSLLNTTFINLQTITPNLINVDAIVGGDLTVTGPGFRTIGGYFTADVEGNVNINSTGLHTAGGNIMFDVQGNFTVSGLGISTSGGNFTAKIGGNSNFSATTLQTLGGDIELNTSGNLTHTGLAFLTNGGNFTASGIDLSTAGIDTRIAMAINPAGFIDLDFSGNISIIGPDLRGGDITIKAHNITSSAGGLVTNDVNPGVGGNLKITATGNIIYPGAGISVNGNADIISNNLTMFGTGLNTRGGNINLCQSGNIELSGYGLASLSPALMNAPFGNININAGGFVSVRSGSGVYTGAGFFNGSTTNSDGGDVFVRADSIYLYSGSINTGMRRASYAGGGVFNNGYLVDSNTGTLTTLPALGTPSSILVQNFSQITGMVTSYPGNLIPNDPAIRFLGPYLGGGNVTLDVQSPMQACIVAPPSEPIPSMGTWALMILSLLLVIFGYQVLQSTNNYSEID